MTKCKIIAPPCSREDIERDVKRLHQRVAPDVLAGQAFADVEWLFEVFIPIRLGIETDYVDLSYLGDGVLGFTDIQQRKSFVDSRLIDSEHIPTVRRCRATIAHEAGHCFMHAPILSSLNSHKTDFTIGFMRKTNGTIKAYENPEWQAWEWAMAYLMPKAQLIACHEKGYSINDMARRFDVNPSFVEVRMKRLKIK